MPGQEKRNCGPHFKSAKSVRSADREKAKDSKEILHFDIWDLGPMTGLIESDLVQEQSANVADIAFALAGWLSSTKYPQKCTKPTTSEKRGFCWKEMIFPLTARLRGVEDRGRATMNRCWVRDSFHHTRR